MKRFLNWIGALWTGLIAFIDELAIEQGDCPHGNDRSDCFECWSDMQW